MSLGNFYLRLTGFSFKPVTSAHMAAAGFMTYTAAGHQGAVEIFWLHFRGAVRSSMFSTAIVWTTKDTCHFHISLRSHVHIEMNGFESFTVMRVTSSKMTDSINSLGGGHQCEQSAASSTRSCHICCLQAVKYFFISLLPRFLKCHLCLMAVLISCIWKTHSGHY